MPSNTTLRRQAKLAMAEAIWIFRGDGKIASKRIPRFIKSRYIIRVPANPNPTPEPDPAEERAA
jgi:hypothetical protein